MNHVSQRNFNGLQREMKALADCGVPQIKPMGEFVMEPGGYLVGFPSLGGNSPPEGSR
ncbi:MAG: hypothetical protein ACKOPM_16080 [Novosphingobium sp.]